MLEKQLQELEEALLASILEMEEYRRGCSSSSFSSPLQWADGLQLVHSCPPPLDQHLLSLLGGSAVRLLPQHLLLLPCFWTHTRLSLNFNLFRRSPGQGGRRWNSNLKFSSKFLPGEAFRNLDGTSRTGWLTQVLASRLIQYPPPPYRGRITVTKEDLACLNAGEFLNDVIIDFYLKSVVRLFVPPTVPDGSGFRPGD